MKIKKKHQPASSLFLEVNLTEEKPWYELLSDLSTINESKYPVSESKSYTSDESQLFRIKGEALIEHQERSFKNNLPAELSFYLNLLENGTKSDRLAAYGFLVAKTPHYFTTKLRDWMKWISTGMTRTESIVDALISMAQVFSNSILPTNRKLLFLEQRSGPLNPPDSQLWAWAVEDAFKRAYIDLLRLIEIQLISPYEQLRLRLLPILSNLLSGHPEQESSLLGLLIDRLGDHSKKVASTAGRSILNVVFQHPAMSDVIISTIWQKVLNDSSKESIAASKLHSRYYGIVLLTQIPLDSRFEDLSKKLITIYVSLIGVVLSYDDDQNNKKKTKTSSLEAHNEKLLSFLLKGLHKAFMITKSSPLASFDILFKLTHTGSWSKSLQSFWLLYKISKGHKALDERFQKTLWESLVDYRSIGQGKAQIDNYFLLLKTFLIDNISTPSLILTFVKRWLSRLISESTATICAALQIILEIFLMIAKNKYPLKEVITPPGDVNNCWDPLKRDPNWSGIIDKSTNKLSCSFFEIVPFLEYYYPSVVILAKAIIVATKGINIKEVSPELILKNSTSNPLDSFSIGAFLDRWAYKNPKKHNLSYKRSIIPSSTEFALLPASNIDPSDVFYHKYFTKKPKRITSQSKVIEEDEFEGNSELNYVDDEEVNYTHDDLEEISDSVNCSDGLSDVSELFSQDINNSDEEALQSPEDKRSHKKQKKIKLPLLASAEDYQKLIN